jgi:delta-aminolevulinic acid dehydratase/porphobilinogen synthase
MDGERILNDETVAVLVKQALNQARPAPTSSPPPT